MSKERNNIIKNKNRTKSNPVIKRDTYDQTKKFNIQNKKLDYNINIKKQKSFMSEETIESIDDVSSICREDMMQIKNENKKSTSTKDLNKG